MHNAFDGLLSRLSMAEERIAELEIMTVKTSKLKKKKRMKNNTEYPRTGRQLQKMYNKQNGTNRKRRIKGTDKIFEVIMTEKFPKLVSHIKPQVQKAQSIPSRKQNA